MLFLTFFRSMLSVVLYLSEFLLALAYLDTRILGTLKKLSYAVKKKIDYGEQFANFLNLFFVLRSKKPVFL